MAPRPDNPVSATLADLSTVQAQIAARRGRVLLVNHFATWCSGCVDEMPHLVALRREMPEVEFLGVCWELFMHDATPKEAVARLDAFAAEQGMDFPILIYTGEPDAIIRACGIETGTIPHTVVYDSQGHVVIRVENPLEGEADVERLRGALRMAR